jgi:N-methylhydantoinase A/oxoprolinase/acetone carboxylase beta subunit
MPPGGGEKSVYSVDIDVGGTLTDGLFRDATRTVCAKVDSTPHDLTVCLFDCLAQGGAELGFPDLGSFLEEVDLLRWSTTLTSNVLAELRGPKLGLLVTSGHERDLYSSQQPNPILNRLVDPKNVIGIDGMHDNAILRAVRALLESGVRRICISLKGAFRDPEPEARLKRIIDEQYPDHYLGSVPVLTGSDVCSNSDDSTRTYNAVINAYIHSALAATLFKAEDELRYTQGYARTFLISHINGGVAGVSKTRALDTLESGPVLGIYGAAYLAKVYGLKKVLALDVGGTTAKLGVVHGGEPLYVQQSDLFGIPVRVTLPYLRSIALGGGSVVSLDGNQLRLGPESMGSFPGPASYGLGGDKATLTDAFVAAGLIDPVNFLGGNKPLNADAAREAITGQVASPRGISVEQACSEIVDGAFNLVADMIARASRELGQDLSDHVLFAYGGNGGLFACGVAQRAGIRRVHLFDLGPVFSAFGSSVSDIVHVYERSFRLPLGEGSVSSDIGSLNRLLEEMRDQGKRDLLGEGISPEGAECSVELEISGADGKSYLAKSPQINFASVAELQRVVTPSVSFGDGTVELVRMRLQRPIAKPALVEREKEGPGSGSARLGTRTVMHDGKRQEAALYRWESLAPGNTLQGCAILGSANSTYLVLSGWGAEIDSYGNALLSRNS